MANSHLRLYRAKQLAWRTSINSHTTYYDYLNIYIIKLHVKPQIDKMAQGVEIEGHAAKYTPRRQLPDA